MQLVVGQRKNSFVDDYYGEFRIGHGFAVRVCDDNIKLGCGAGYELGQARRDVDGEFTFIGGNVQRESPRGVGRTSRK